LGHGQKLQDPGVLSRIQTRRQYSVIEIRGIGMRLFNFILLCCLVAVAPSADIELPFADSGQQRHQDSLHPQVMDGNVIVSFLWLGS
jgi:hypothetical protein